MLCIVNKIVNKASELQWCQLVQSLCAVAEDWNQCSFPSVLGKFTNRV